MQDVALVSMVQAAADVDEESTVGGGMKGEGRRGGEAGGLVWLLRFDRFWFVLIWLLVWLDRVRWWIAWLVDVAGWCVGWLNIFVGWIGWSVGMIC